MTNSTSDRFFLDTNVFVYSWDRRDPAKQSRASALVRGALESGQGVISYQVVQEFVNVALRKFAKPMTVADCLLYLETVLSPLCGVFPDAGFYAEGLRIRELTGFSYYDALIVTAALRAGCRTLYSEDLQDGREIGTLVIRNPFTHV